MPILSSYSPSSEKPAVSGANAAPRAGADEPKTRFSSLLDALAPSAAQKNATVSKTSDKTTPAEKDSAPVKSKADSARKTDRKKGSGKKADDNGASETTEKPDNQKASNEPSVDASGKNEADEQTPAASDSDAADQVEASTQESSKAEQTATTDIAAMIAVANTQPAQSVDDSATDDAKPDAKGEQPQAVGSIALAAQNPAAVAVQQPQTSTSDPNLMSSDEESSGAESNAPIQAAIVDPAGTMNASDPANSSTGAENQAGKAKTEKSNALESKELLQNPEIQEDAPQSAEKSTKGDDFGKALEKMLPRESVEGNLQAVQTPSAQRTDPQVAFATQAAQSNPDDAMEQNRDRIVTAVESQISTKGGSMRIRLDPPELGSMQVKVEMRGETVSATFQTSNDQAAKILTHGLGMLKSALERQGLSVDRLQVQTTRNDAENSNMGDSNNGSSTAWQGYQNQQDQQRRQTLNQMWKRASTGRDPLDMVA